MKANLSTWLTSVNSMIGDPHLLELGRRRSSGAAVDCRRCGRRWPLLIQVWHRRMPAGWRPGLWIEVPHSLAHIWLGSAAGGGTLRRWSWHWLGCGCTLTPASFDQSSDQNRQSLCVPSLQADVTACMCSK